MARPSAPAKDALMNAAERLIAQHGIAQVSSRRIAEEAGNTNHSAVAYHFGSREGLLQQMVERQVSELEPRRAAMIDALGDDGEIIDYVRATVLPMTESLGALPQPSWRARFIRQALADPAIGHLFDEDPLLAPSLRRVARILHTRLSHIHPDVINGRFTLMAHMITAACATYEERISEHPEQADWSATGRFLTDAAAGLVSAPDTSGMTSA
ncbi:TetR/AcrR family transcriptional regulator [Microterricola viridarii]|nr:TetR/AcrR family transcriptional regulator [Microterricola viridarii]